MTVRVRRRNECAELGKHEYQMVANPTINIAGVDAQVDDGMVIDRCGSCGTSIALLAPTANSPASAWLCRRCGSVYFARCQEKDGKPFCPVTRRVSYCEVMKAIYIHLEGDACPILREDVQRSLEQSAARPFYGREARKQKRYPAAALVTAVPLGADFRVAAQPARIMTINLSGGGAAVLHSRRIHTPYLAIDFSASGIELLPAILQVTRVRTLPASYEIAGKFVSRIL